MNKSDMSDAEEDETDAVVIYPLGKKNFWRTGIVLEFILVEHKQHKVIEVITLKSARTSEQSRLYMSTPILMVKFAEAVEKAEACQTGDEEADEEYEREVKTKVLQELAVEFVRTRIVPLDGTAGAWLTVLDGDQTRSDGQLDVICSKPPTLMMYMLHDAPVKKMK